MSRFEFDPTIKIEIDENVYRLKLTQKFLEDWEKGGETVKEVGRDVQASKPATEEAEEKAKDKMLRALSNAIDLALGKGEYAKLTKGRKPDAYEATRLYAYLVSEINKAR